MTINNPAINHDPVASARYAARLEGQREMRDRIATTIAALATHEQREAVADNLWELAQYIKNLDYNR